MWNVISGCGRSIIDGQVRSIKAGDVLDMKAGSRHTVLADTELKIIEIQFGKEISVQDKQKFEFPAL